MYNSVDTTLFLDGKYIAGKHTHRERVLNHRMFSNAVNLLVRENILQLQSLISTVTQFQLSFPGLK